MPDNGFVRCRVHDNDISS